MVIKGHGLEEFWARLLLCLKAQKEFVTLKRMKKFEAVIADSQTVTVTPRSTKTSRPVPMNMFRQMWGIMKNDVRNERHVGREGRYSRFRSKSYVNALIDYIVGNQDMR